jgi:hypothetical protein
MLEYIYQSTKLRGSTLQQTVIFMFTAVITTVIANIVYVYIMR